MGYVCTLIILVYTTNR